MRRSPLDTVQAVLRTLLYGLTIAVYAAFAGLTLLVVVGFATALLFD